MRAARELWSPLAPALALTAAALFFGGGPAAHLPWLGAAAVLLAAVLFAARGPARSGRRAPAARRARRLVRRSRSPGRSSPTAAGTTRTGRSSTSPSRSSAPSSPAGRASSCSGSSRAARRGLRLVARRQGPALAVRGLRADRAPARAGRLLEQPRAARRHRAAARALPRDAAARPGHAARLRLDRRDRRSPTRAAASSSRVVVVALWLALSRAWLEALATLVAAGAPGGRGADRRLLALGGDERRRSRTRRAFATGSSSARCSSLDAAIAAALARFPPPEPTPAVRRAALALADGRRRGCDRSSAASTRARGGTSSRRPATTELSNSPGRLDRGGLEPPLGLVEGGVARLRKPTSSPGTGAGSFGFTNLRYRTTTSTEAIEPHDLPVQFLSETGRRRARALPRRRVALARRGARRRPARSSRSRSRCPRTSCTGCSTSTGTSPPSARRCS